MISGEKEKKDISCELRIFRTWHLWLLLLETCAELSLMNVSRVNLGTNKCNRGVCFYSGAIAIIFTSSFLSSAPQPHYTISCYPPKQCSIAKLNWPESHAIFHSSFFPGTLSTLNTYLYATWTHICTPTLLCISVSDQLERTTSSSSPAAIPWQFQVSLENFPLPKVAFPHKPTISHPLQILDGTLPLMYIFHIAPFFLK